LLAWCSGITDVDPLEFGLLFERFLNPARVSMPDIDVDFEDQSRDMVLEYVAQRYGADHISKIGTFMKMASKAAFKDVARVMGVPFDVSNVISNLIPLGVKLTDISQHLDNYEDLKKIIESEPRLQKTLEMSAKLENNMRQL
jgi:DNA polymerase-3 subunit alpha